MSSIGTTNMTIMPRPLLTVRHAVVACVRGHTTFLSLCHVYNFYVVVHAFFIINDGFLSYACMFALLLL